MSLSLTLAVLAGAVGCAPCDGRVALGSPVPLTSVALGDPIPAAVPALAATPSFDAPAVATPSVAAPIVSAPPTGPVVTESSPAPAPIVEAPVVTPAVETPIVTAPAVLAPPVVSARPVPTPPTAVEPTPNVPVRDVAAPRASSPSPAGMVAVRPAQPVQEGAPAVTRQTPPAPLPDAPRSMAQTATPDPAASAPVAGQSDAGLRVFVMTMGPGDAVWERFGHNAIWVHDPAAGTDLAYNYGLFDFRQENFVGRFVQGRMLYWMDGFDANATVDHYARQNRDVWVQELALTPAEKREIRDFLAWNAREENRFYRYDYYRDNCSTRVRDVLDRVLGGRLRAGTEGVATDATYRSHTARLTAGSVPEYSGLMVGLGPAADRPIDAWEEMFLPMKVRDRLRQMQTVDENGRTVPLVRWDTLAAAAVDREAERTEPPFRIPWYALGGALLGGALVLLGRRAPASAAARFGFAALASLWLILVALGGVVLAGLWGWTDHAIAYGNENLFQFSPLALPLILLVPALAYGARWAARPAAWLALAGAGLAVLGLVLQVLPGLDQVNGETIGLALPVHLGLAWAVLRLRDATLARPARTAAAAD